MGIGGTSEMACRQMLLRVLYLSFYPFSHVYELPLFVTVINYNSHECTATKRHLVMSTVPTYRDAGRCGLAFFLNHQ